MYLMGGVINDLCQIQLYDKDIDHLKYLAFSLIPYHCFY